MAPPWRSARFKVCDLTPSAAPPATTVAATPKTAKARFFAHPATETLASVGTLVLLHLMVSSIGMGWHWRITLALAVGAAARRLLPLSPYHVMMATGLVVLYLWKPRFIYFEVPLLAALWLLRHRFWLFWMLLLAAGVALPKTLHRSYHRHTSMWNWVSEAAVGHILLVAMLYWFEKRRGRLEDPTYPQWMTLFASASNPLNPLNLGPLEMWRQPAVNVVGLARSLILIACKGLALWTLEHPLSSQLVRDKSFEALSSLSVGGLWLSVALSYVRLALYLSGTADVAIVILRTFGWHLGHPFRWALLAWNPVELWRRWSIYNRKLLLKCFYFPLGGGNKRRYLNVMVTFWASALVLHTGWVGSIYWLVGVGGLRDQTVYFTLQGVAVCACLMLWQRTGKDPASDKQFRLSATRVLGTLGTQAYSALVHIVVMIPSVTWSERWVLMGRCLGLPL